MLGLSLRFNNYHLTFIVCTFMKFFTRNCFVIATGIITLAGCKKDIPKTKTELLTEKDWVPVGIIEEATPVGGGATVTTDMFALDPPCSSNEYTRYERSGTVTYQYINNCSTPPQIATGTWQFESNEAMISWLWNGQSSPFKVTLDELTESSLKFSFSNTRLTSSGLQDFKYHRSYRPR